jgi:hypothetical protein
MLKKISDLFFHLLPGHRNFQVEELGRCVKAVEVVIEERDAAFELKEIIKDAVAALEAKI